ncbi:alkaline phosphatase D family protein [Streptomyces sp. YIM B13518]|uniref:alkaline phosphatase D family protein n=1 Tax=Streptomyces sp. YIM B13518 TaxID=3366316 RepID=UPI0036AA28AC
MQAPCPVARVAAHAPGARPRSPGRAAAGQAHGATPRVPGPEPDDPARTLTGDAQERRPLDGRTSTAPWNVMRRQMCFSPRGPAPNAEAKGSMDARDGYRAARGRPAAGAKAAGVAGWAGPHRRRPVAHAFGIKDDVDDPDSAVLGTEPICTSVAGGRDGAEHPAPWGTACGPIPT